MSVGRSWQQPERHRGPLEGAAENAKGGVLADAALMA